MAAQQNEPIFVRSRRGTKHWVYNWRNPVGRALIVITTVVPLGTLLYLSADSRWSEGEFRDAVHASARNLEAHPQDAGTFYGYEQLIRDAIERTGKGPSNGAVQVTLANASSDSSSDDFEITTLDVNSTYCMSISPPAPTTYTERRLVRLSVQVTDGQC